jgi:hypothetical protein
VALGRLDGRGHEGEGVDHGTPKAIMGKWLELSGCGPGNSGSG